MTIFNDQINNYRYKKNYQCTYKAINSFINFDIPLESQRLSHVSDLNELYQFYDKMIGIDFEIIDNHLDILL